MSGVGQISVYLKDVNFNSTLQVFGFEISYKFTNSTLGLNFQTKVSHLVAIMNLCQPFQLNNNYIINFSPIFFNSVDGKFCYMFNFQNSFKFK